MDNPRDDTAVPPQDALCICGHPYADHTQAAGHFALCRVRIVPADIDPLGFCSCVNFTAPEAMPA